MASTNQTKGIPSCSNELMNQPSGVYEDIRAKTWQYGDIPQDTPYNRVVDGKPYTFATPQAYQNLCAKQGIQIAHFAEEEEERMYSHIASKFGISQFEVKSMYNGASTPAKGTLIKKMFKNPKLTGVQRSDGVVIIDDVFECLLPVTVKIADNDYFLIAKLNAAGGGSIMFTNKTNRSYSLSL